MYMLLTEDLKKKLSSMDSKRRLIKIIGSLLLSLSVIFLLLTYEDYIKANIQYAFSSKGNEDVVVSIKPNGTEEVEDIETESEDKTVFIDPFFGLYIPKIGANSNVIPNVSPYIETEYTSALTKGVAHAKGTALPNEGGNTFLFAHSAVNFYEQRKYNVYFYLLTKLEENDDIYVSYDSEVYRYAVKEVKIVEPTDIKYLGRYKDRETITLMTCWPAGFNLKRVIVVADRVVE